MLVAQGPRDQIPALVGSDHGNTSTLDVGAGEEQVEHRGEHRLPVGSRGDCALVQCCALAGAVERHPVVLVFARGGARADAELRGGCLPAVVEDDQWPRLAGEGAGRAQEEAGERRLLVGDRESLARAAGARPSGVGGRRFGPPRGGAAIGEIRHGT